MDLIPELLVELGKPLIRHSAEGVYQWVVGFIRGRLRVEPTAKVLKTLHDLGCQSDAAVREMVQNWKPADPVSSSEREQLATLLANLVRGARFHTTQGTPLSSYLRSERLIEQLLANIEPKRKAGESVAVGKSDWKLDRFLGMGSFGEVWVGRAKLHPDPRAFKFFTMDAARAWLAREGETLFEVQRHLAGSPNVIRYVDFALDGDPYPYLVLEYIPGGSLEDLILRPESERDGLRAAELMIGIARGLAAAHAHGITHRDLKPANVLLTVGPDPDPKIADFGLGRVDADQADGSSYASQAAVVGTRTYLPPEAANPYQRRSPAQDDVFAFGVVWYQVLTGTLDRPPYDFADRLKTDGIDSRTIRLLSRCLAREDRRYRDATELLTELDRGEVPPFDPVPEGCYDVGPLAREYLEEVAG